MDPLTAALTLANTMLELAKLVIESQPPEVRVELWRFYLEDLKEWREDLRAWRAFWEQRMPKP